MSQLTKVRELIPRPVPRSRIERLVNRNFGECSPAANTILKAADLTRDLNKGKKRKNGDARISHEREMFIILCEYLNIRDPILSVAIFLHDLYEENPRQWPLKRIEQEFGQEVRDLVWAVSKPRMTDAELVSAYGSEKVALRVIGGGQKAITLKLIDRFHFFLRPFKTQDRRRLVWKVAQTLRYIQPMTFEVGVLVSELELIVAESIRRNNIITEELMEFSPNHL